MATVRIIAAPYHAGVAGVRVGAGPTRLLDDGIEAALRSTGLDVALRMIGAVDEFEGEIGRSFELKRRIAIAVAEARSAGAFPLVLSGNCNASVGVAAGVGDAQAGLLWFDAHSDFDTPDEHRSGYFDGMGVATLAGQCWHAMAATIPGFRPLELDRLVYCGIRDFEPGQREKVEAAGIRAVFGSVEERVDFASRLSQEIAGRDLHRAMVHLDLDCLDTSVGRANDYASPGGLTAEDLDACVDVVCTAARPLSLTIASFDPALEGADRISSAAIAAALAICTAGAP